MKVNWKSIRRLTPAILMAAVSGAVLSNCTSTGSNDLIFSGRIEGTESHLGVVMPGRVHAVSVEEGDTVHKGQVLLTLDDAQLTSKQKDADAVLTAATAEQKQTKDWWNGLKAAGSRVSQFDLMQASMRMARVNAEVAQAQAAKNELDSKLQDFSITSPQNGVCSACNVAAGEVVAPGQSLLSVTDMNALKMRAFVPEGDLSKIRIGSRATVTLDGLPDKAIQAHVASIDPQASFTPENVYFKNDRVRQVFGVTLKLDTADGAAKPGMPADARLALSSETH